MPVMHTVHVHVHGRPSLSATALRTTSQHEERKVVTTTHTASPAATLHVGDTQHVLAAMPVGSVDCIVTSPPYWGKRDYDVAGQYGREDSPGAYVEKLRDVFGEAPGSWPATAPAGSTWATPTPPAAARSPALHVYAGASLTGRRARDLPPKNLLGLPWRVALALQEDGWILRNAIVWHKPNAMPESVRDRMNCRHELIFLLVKQAAYWFNLDPIRIPHAGAPATRQRPPGAPERGRRPGGPARPPKYGPHTRQVTAVRRYGTGRTGRAHPRGRNPGDVWSINTRPYRGPHFAAFPVDIPLRVIAAGCRPGGMVLDPFCGTGTTGLAALTLGRRFTGIDLNPEFAALAAERLRQAAGTGPDDDQGGSR